MFRIKLKDIQLQDVNIDQIV